MNDPLTTARDVLIQLCGRALGGPVFLARHVAVATLSLASALLELKGDSWVSDIRSLKQSLMKRVEAETDAKVAESQRKLAEATEASNRANLPRRRDAIARAELEMTQAQAAKTRVEAEAILLELEIKRMQAVAEAQTRLLEALVRLKREGGEVFLDADGLERLLKYGNIMPDTRTGISGDADDAESQ